jgi:endonuclease/exonuclease/phosphatase (EEP) superfamily protein YafD
MSIGGDPAITSAIIVKRFLRVCVGLGAVAYPVALIGLALAMRYVGEQSWVTTVLLYLPRRYLALPLPLLVVMILVVGPRWLFVTQLGAAALLLFPILGLRVSGAPEPTSGHVLRLLSYNGSFGHMGTDKICPEVEAAHPDVVLLQAYSPRLLEPLKSCVAGFTIQTHGQFLIATRFPIAETFVPPALEGGGSANFVRYTLESSLGPLDVYNAHPISPREGIDRFRKGIEENSAQAIDPGILSDDRHRPVQENTDLRHAQVKALAAAAQSSRHPVVIAGDTNLPGLSWFFATYLGHLQDGFAEVGRGFGYTFPAARPSMRIDRVLAGPEFRFTHFAVGERTQTSHRCVIAELTRR